MGDGNVKTCLPVVTLTCSASISTHKGDVARHLEDWGMLGETCSVQFHSSYFYEMIPTLFIFLKLKINKKMMKIMN